METESNEGDEGVVGRLVVRVCASCTGAEAGRMLLLSLSIKSFMLSSLYREKRVVIKRCRFVYARCLKLQVDSKQKKEKQEK